MNKSKLNDTFLYQGKKEYVLIYSNMRTINKIDIHSGNCNTKSNYSTQFLNNWVKSTWGFHYGG